MATTTALVIQLAKSAIDALVLDRLQHPPPQVPRDFAGVCPGGHYRLRWCRPALTFPDDAPGMVRMGLTFEGSVQFDSGRILSCDTFVTATATPALTHDENGWYIRLSIAQIQPGTLHLDYAGRDLATARALFGADLPDDTTMAQLRDVLTERIVQFCEEFPDIPLTYVFPSQIVTTEVVAVQVRPESRGAALTITIAAGPDDGAAEVSMVSPATVEPPLIVTVAQNAAMAVPAAALASAFAQTWSADVPLVTSAGDTITRLAVQCSDGALLLDGDITSPPTASATEHSAFQMRLHVAINAGAWQVTFTPVTAAAEDDEGVVPVTSSHLAKDAAFAATLARHIGQALDAALAPVVGAATGALTWQWQAARTATTGMVNFTPIAVSVTDTGLTLSGALPLEPDESSLPDDGPSFDLQTVIGRADPLATATGEPIITVRAVHQNGIIAPIDYAWQSSLATPLLGEHAVFIELHPTQTPADTSMPRHTQKLPRGIVEVTATLIDGFGRVGQAVVEIDMTARTSGALSTNETARVGVLVDAQPARLPTAPTAAVYGAEMAATRPTRATGSVTAHATSYRAAQTLPKNAMPWKVLASILAMLALIFAIGAYFLLHAAPLAGAGQRSVTPASTPTIALTPQITVAPTATTAAGTLTTAPTSPPAAFGRFDTATAMLQFTCAGGSTTPQTVTFDDNGTGPLDWSAHVVDTIAANVPWATITPTSGTLTPQVGDVATITVTPAAGFCAAATPASFRIQLTAPNAVPLTLVATHTVVATATVTPPLPTVTPTP